MPSYHVWRFLTWFVFCTNYQLSTLYLDSSSIVCKPSCLLCSWLQTYSCCSQFLTLIHSFCFDVPTKTGILPLGLCCPWLLRSALASSLLCCTWSYRTSVGRELSAVNIFYQPATTYLMYQNWYLDPWASLSLAFGVIIGCKAVEDGAVTSQDGADSLVHS